MSGFVYVWFDRLHRRYYVGSHWGDPSDGYICSSAWMRSAHRQRCADFKRRIVAVVATSKFDLHEEEHRWLQMIKPSELKVRYYNMANTVKDNWVKYDGDKTLRPRQKISKALTGMKRPPETRARMSAAFKGRQFSAETRAKLSAKIKGRPISAAALAKHKARRSTPESRAKNSAAHKGRIKSRDHLAKMAAGVKAAWVRRKQSTKRLVAPRSLEHREKLSAALKSAWRRRKGEYNSPRLL